MIKYSKLKIKNSKLKTFLFTLLFTIIIGLPVMGVDADITRQTIRGLGGVNVIVEEIQPNVQKYAQRAGITKEQIQKDVEAKLKSNGIKVLTKDEWLKTPGRPVLYVNINTHETEKYWYAYNIVLALKQVVSLEANPSIKTLASTWSINMTGMANIGTLGIIKTSVDDLVGRFVNACK
jgi:hypothetical protein